MKRKYKLDFNDVDTILAAAHTEATVHGWPVTIAVVDDGGHLLGLRRLDDAPAVSAKLAPAKAKTSALGRRESKFYEEILNNGRPSFLSVAPMLGAMLEGGVPIIVDGDIIGVIGAGVLSHEDAQVARIGVAALRNSVATS